MAVRPFDKPEEGFTTRAPLEVSMPVKDTNGSGQRKMHYLHRNNINPKMLSLHLKVFEVGLQTPAKTAYTQNDTNHTDTHIA